MTDTTSALATFATDFPTEEIPERSSVVVQRRLAGLSCLSIAGKDDPAVTATLESLTALGSPQQAGLLGRTERLGLSDAPIVTAASMDCGWKLGSRDGHHAPFDGPIASAALAVGDYTSATGRDLIAALVLGCELGRRVEDILQQDLLRNGWDAGAVSSRLGAVAAAGRLLGLTAAQMVSALGIAATQVAGLAAAGPTPAGSVSRAKAAGDGVEAALLALGGFDGPAAPLEGRRGLFAVLSQAADNLKSPVAGLGRSWLVDDLSAELTPEPSDAYGSTRRAVAELTSADDLSELYAAARQDGAS